VPTHLPPPKPRVEKKGRFISAVLNTFMVVSALALTFVVLVQEQRFADGQPGPLAGSLATILQQSAGELPSDEQAILPPD